MDAGYLETRFEPGNGMFVAVSPTGRALLAKCDRASVTNRVNPE
jgi:hypothetical protein